MKKTVIAVVVVILLCCGAYFAWQWYQQQKTPPEPERVNEFDRAIYDSLSAVHGEDEFVLSEITAENAVNAIRQIKNGDKYYATFTVERFSGDVTERTENTVWVNSEKYRVEMSGDTNKTIICDGEKVKIINNDRATSNVMQNGSNFTYNSQIGVVDMAYFLDNAENELITADYAESVGRNSGNIIYVEFYYPVFNQLEKFYISADYGVVLAAQTYTDDVLTYRLTTDQFTADYVSDETMFDIPD